MTDNPQTEAIQVGDTVHITHLDQSAQVIQVREFDGKYTYVVDTEKGNRIVVGAREVTKQAM